MNHTSKSVNKLLIILFSKKSRSNLNIFEFTPRKMWIDMSKSCRSIIHQHLKKEKLIDRL